MHHDADGVASCSLFLLANKLTTGDVDVVFPDEFGDVGDADVVLDMSPSSLSYTGIVYDHHPQSRQAVEAKKAKYKLLWDHVPTSVVVFQRHKADISPEHWWKVAIGCAGDSQIAAIPAEILLNCPHLFESMVSFYAKYGKMEAYPHPVYRLLSSPVNSYCRAGREREALDLVMTVKDPLALVTDLEAKKIREMLDTEVSNALARERGLLLQHRMVVVFSYESSHRLEGLVATRLGEGGDTVVAVNEATGNLSIRGDLTGLVVHLLNKADIKVAGHAGFAGGRLGKKVLSDLVDALR